MSLSDLTPSTVSKLKTQINVDAPRLQLVDLSALGTSAFLGQLSDGTETIFALITDPKFVQYCNNGVLEEGNIISLNRYSFKQARTDKSGNEKTILLLADFAIANSNSLDVIGNPNIQKYDPPAAAPRVRKVLTEAEKAKIDRDVRKRMAENNGGSESSSSPSKPKAPVKMNRIMVSEIDPFRSFSIKVIVKNVESIRSWNNAKGSGTLQGFTLMDCQEDASKRAEIKLTLFKDAIGKFAPSLKEGSTVILYGFVGKSLTEANKRYDKTKHSCSLDVTDESRIEVCNEDPSKASAIPLFNLIKIDEVVQKQKEDIVSVIGIVSETSQSAQRPSKTGKLYSYKDIVITDESLTSIKARLMFDCATNNDDLKKGDIIFIKEAQVGTYEGRSLSCTQGVIVNPKNMPEAEALEKWWVSVDPDSIDIRSISGSNQNKKPTSAYDPKVPRFLSCRMPELENKTNSSQNANSPPEFVSFKGNILTIRHDKASPPWYMSCPGVGCRKGMVQQGNGIWFCSKCAGSYENGICRWILSMLLVDGSGSFQVTAFEEVGNVIMGMTADSLYKKMKEDPDIFDVVFKEKFLSEYAFIISGKIETYSSNGKSQETKMKYTVVHAEPVDWSKEIKILKNDV